MSKTAIITTITPQMAKDLMGTNTNNRKISRVAVERYARDMAEGRWHNNGQSILVSDEGVLMDGQHRLLACIRANKPFQAFLVRGVPQDALSTIDAGRKRSPADALTLAGHAIHNVTRVAAAARLSINYLRGERMASAPSASEVFDFVEAQPELAEKVNIASVAKVIAPASSLGAVLFLGTRERGHERQATAFAEALESGAGLRDGDPRLTLRNLLINTRARTPGGGLPNASWMFPVITTAWNAFLSNDRLSIIKPTPNRQGRFTIINVSGGPEYGAGVSAIMEGHISKERIAQLRASEEAARAKLLEEAE